VSAYSPEARDRLRILIDDLTCRNGLQFADVAQRAGISAATLRRARHRFDTPITTGTLRGLERAYDLGHRELDKFLATPDYQPQPKAKPLTPETSTSDDVIRFLRRFVAAQPGEARRLRAKFETFWDKR
jgi:transcriptional regulator with XRE-family HTH domain